MRIKIIPEIDEGDLGFLLVEPHKNRFRLKNDGEFRLDALLDQVFKLDDLCCRSSAIINNHERMILRDTGVALTKTFIKT